MIASANVPGHIATIINCGLASLIELQTVYGVEDVYDMIEVAAVEGYNRAQAAKRTKP